jgi:hypothetical protein
MYEDPIVTEVRQAGQTLAEQAEGDLHTFFQNLRKAQQQYRERLVHAPLRPSEAAEASPGTGGEHQASYTLARDCSLATLIRSS